MPINLQNYIGGKYLQKEDVPQPRTETIRDVHEEDFDGDGKKLILLFVELPKGMVANKTNLRLAVDILGSKDVDAWKGRQLTLYNDPEIMFQGHRTGGLRFRAPPVTSNEEVPF